MMLLLHWYTHCRRNIRRFDLNFSTWNSTIAFYATVIYMSNLHVIFYIDSGHHDIVSRKLKYQN